MPASGTSVAARTAPPRRFENYILTRVVDSSAGLTEFKDADFTQLQGTPDYTGYHIGQGFCDDGYSFVYPIGFDFELDGVVYKQFVANVNGWMALVDPALGAFNPAEVISGSPWQNPYIKATFTSNAVLLAPWFDDLRNVAEDPTKLTASPTAYSATKVARIAAGLEPRPTQLDSVAYGVSFKNDVRSTKGRRLIIRWNCLSNYSNPSTVLKFEVVLYENGKIEYRYASRANLALQGGNTPEGATIGIFMPNGTNRFRDFAIGLGYRDEARQEYQYGGYAYTSNYVDTLSSYEEDAPASASYTISLSPSKYWPGLTTGGSVFTFRPPTNRRKVLPRLAVRSQDAKQQLPLVARTGDSRLGTYLRFFDDRKSPTYGNSTTTVVNYPTTLPRFYGGTGLGTFERQNLFSGDMLVTGAISKSAIEPYVDEGPVLTVEPFNESHRAEQDEATLSSPFYTTGSNLNYLDAGFIQPLKSKTHVKVSLPIDTAVQLPAATSSIYYYNLRARCWEVPANSTYILSNGGTTPPANPSPAGGDWANPASMSSNGVFIEDARGFGAFGEIVSSGSQNPAASQGTDAAFNAKYSQANAVAALSKKYAKSVRSNDEYSPTGDETFTLPITTPFLIEKMVIEIPMAMGPGWFQDMTQVFQPLGSAGTLDIGGPALTVALSRQVPLNAEGISGGRSFNSDNGGVQSSLRDLILTGTITHNNDYASQLVLSNFPPYDNTFQLRPVGFLAYANPAGAVVQTGGSQQFTGSVKVLCEALGTSGLVLIQTQSFNNTSASNAASTLALMTQHSQVGLNNAFIVEASPFGRGGEGMQQSGRSMLGNEYATFQSLSDPSGLTAPNPFYITSSANLTAQQAAVLTNPPTGFAVNAAAAIPMISHFPSPYLVMPGDKLVLSISKKRPVMFNAGGQWFSGSLAHDVQLRPGTIHITFYGSLVQEATEFHDTLNQSLASDVCHELIGAEPVLDQFEPAYRGEYSGSFTDNVMVGNLLTTQFVNGRLTFMSGTRDRKLSVLRADLSASIFVDKRTGNVTHDQYRKNGVTTSGFPTPLPNETIFNSTPSTLGLTWTDAAINPSKAYRTQPWVEQVGSVRLSQFVDNTERYWDSLMPDVHQCFAADGCGIFLTRYGSFGNAQQVNAVTASYIGQAPIGDYLPQGTQPLGWLWFDNMRPDLLAAGYGPLINGNWTKAYPFEPRYQAASRQLDVSRGLIATYLFQPSVQQTNITNTPIPAGNPLITSIPPTQVGGFLFGPVQQGTSVDSTIIGYDTNNPVFIWVYLFGVWFHLPFYPPIQGLVYTANDICNAWIADCTVGPSASVSSSAGYLNQYGYFTTGSATVDDISRALFGFGDSNTYFQYSNADNSVSLLGAGHFSDTRDQEGPHPDGIGYNGADNNIFKYSPKIRGWKYGVASGLPLFSKAYWRRGRYGQYRDMLEQRPFTKYYESPENVPVDPNFQQGVKEAAVTVRFISPDGRLTGPDNTWSSNLSFECTSSLPYIEGVPTNRPTVNPLTLNKHIISFRQDMFGNLRL